MSKNAQAKNTIENSPDSIPCQIVGGIIVNGIFTSSYIESGKDSGNVTKRSPANHLAVWHENAELFVPRETIIEIGGNEYTVNRVDNDPTLGIAGVFLTGKAT